MDITPPRDSVGTEALKRSNAEKEIAPTDAVTPTPALRDDAGARGRGPEPKGGENAATGHPETERRSGADRRGQERRQSDQMPWLDTRSHRERRTLVRRGDDRERQAEAGESPPIGVNEKA